MSRDRRDVRLLRRPVRRIRGRRRGRHRRGGGPSPAARLARALHALRARQRAVAPQRRPARGRAGQRPARAAARPRRSTPPSSPAGWSTRRWSASSSAPATPGPRRPPPPPHRAAARAGPPACLRPGRSAHGGSCTSTACTIHRPPGLTLDSGGLAKGLFADLLAGELADHDAFAIDCAGDLRVGGARCAPIHVASPFGGERLHTLRDRRRRRRHERHRPPQLDRRRRPPRPPPARPRYRHPRVHRGRPGHGARPDGGRGRDPRQGRRAERPGRRRPWLPHGGVLVFDDGSSQVV